MRTTGMIIKDAERVFGVSDLKERSRRVKVTQARFAAMAILREEKGLRLQQIADAFGLEDHTTVISAIRRCDDLKRIPEYLRKYNKVKFAGLRSM